MRSEFYNKNNLGKVYKKYIEFKGKYGKVKWYIHNVGDEKMEVMFMIIGFIAIALGVAIGKFKCYDLISGYNSASKEAKKNINIDKMAKHIAIMCYIMGTAFIIMPILNEVIGLSYGILMIIIIIFLFSYIIYIQKFNHNKNSKRNTIIMTILFIITGIFMAVSLIYGMASCKVTFSEEDIKISGQYGITINKEDIISCTLIDDMPKIVAKNNGFNDGAGNNKGSFTLDKGEKASLYMQSNKGPFVRLVLKDKNIYINYWNQADTEELYNEFMNNIKKK